MEKFQNGEKNDQQLNDAPICGYDSLHHLLKDNLKCHSETSDYNIQNINQREPEMES